MLPAQWRAGPMRGRLGMVDWLPGSRAADWRRRLGAEGWLGRSRTANWRRRPGGVGWLPGGRGARRGDHGSLAIELVILTPILVLFMAVLVALGRVVEAQGQLDGAARDAARAASIAQDPGAALGDAQTAADGDLIGAGKCADTPDVTFGSGTDLAPGGVVNIIVTCRVGLPALSFIGFETKTITGHASAPIDTFSVGG
jgi:TadE-like protein